MAVCSCYLHLDAEFWADWDGPPEPCPLESGRCACKDRCLGGYQITEPPSIEENSAGLTR